MGYYEKTKPTHTVSILGTNYDIFMGVKQEDDPLVESCDGYCDKTVKRIVVAGPIDICEFADYSVYEKTNLRHELIHAFLFESGLDCNSHWGNDEHDHPEQMVQWISIQFPKLLQVFMNAKAL